MQTLSVSAQTFLDSMNLFLLRAGKPIMLSSENTVFALEENVSRQSHQQRIAPSQVWSFQQFASALPALLVHGPGWLHGNILPIADPVPLVGPYFLVTVETGRNGGSSSPSLNASHEMDKSIVITE